MGNQFRGRKFTVTIHPEDGNLENVLEVVDDLIVVPSEFRAIIVD